MAYVSPTGWTVASALLILSAALVFHGCASRYEFANLNVREMTKRDRLTGRIELCRASREGMVCAPASTR